MEQQKKCEEIAASRDKELNKIGNLIHDSVPVFKDEVNNVTVASWGECKPNPEGKLLHHHELLHMINGYEPEKGVNVAGHRAYFLRDYAVLLNQALVSYGMQFLMQRGYSPVIPPFFMNKDVMAGVAELEQFDEELYHVTGEEGDEKYLIATSEQPLCAIHMNEWLEENQLPIKYAGFSTCFRKEAGAHGKDTWGIFRVHQFDKIEQFVICPPEKSWEMHESMIKVSREFYESLGIPYRVVAIVSGALNNAASKKYDLEGWYPGYGEYRELVSCSNCLDYQSRATNIRLGRKKADDKEKKYVHMLNSTLCALTRTICAVLENYQTPEGVAIPEKLVPYMGGTTFIPFVKDKKVNYQAERQQRALAKKEGKQIPPAPEAAANKA